jgi:alpha-1,2-mannosyltransferase
VGVASALKMTPALFIPYFLLKREWKTATAILATAALLTAAPGLFQARSVFLQEMGVWGMNVWQGMTALDPSATILETPSAANLSLRPALARFVQRYPAGHPLYLDHPGFIQFLDLSPRHAGMLVRSAMAALLLVVGWQFRRRASDGRHPMVLPFELAAVSVLSLLYSPITWKQHAVGLLPAVFLLVCCSIQWDRVTAWMWGALGYYVAFGVLLTRDVTGRPLSLLLESYHVVTWAILLVVILLLVWHRRLLRPGFTMEPDRPSAGCA